MGVGGEAVFFDYVKYNYTFVFFNPPIIST